MEKSLIEKLKNDTCDDIDKDMIVSRVLATAKKLQEASDAFVDAIKQLGDEHKDELKMAGATIVLGVAVPAITSAMGKEDFELVTKIVIGSDKNVKKTFLELMNN